MRELKEGMRLREDICATYGVSTNIHSLWYKDTLARVTVAFSERPDGDVTAVRQAVEVLVRKRFPQAQKVVVTIPEKPSPLPKWWPGSCSKSQ